MDTSDAYFDGISVRVAGSSITATRRLVVGRTGCAGGRRSEISEFSAASRERMLRSLLECEFTYRPKTFITLTYPAQFSNDGRAVKAHLKRFLDRLQRKFPRIRIFWFLEFQERGAPHFHLYCSRLFRKGYIPRLWEWATEHDGGYVWITKIKGSGIGYALKSARRYSAKNEQKTVPVEFRSVGRFWGWRNKPKVVAASITVDWRASTVEAWSGVVELIEDLKNAGYCLFTSDDVPYCLKYWRFRVTDWGLMRAIIRSIGYFGGVVNADCLCISS